ncbi:hypothetical protein EMPS_04487 [Entomortierella parvispora]|uniref:Uncharacterized protein n=1 Tax=Entomortierella parvispora TaxID=205924 RepID=A0A9P3LVV6_9FUNG|nr:hypothetical protein EMPS_04487 [Entomortierella parvispora]
MSDTHDHEAQEVQDDRTLTDEHSPESTTPPKLESPSSTPSSPSPEPNTSEKSTVESDEQPNHSIKPEASSIPLEENDDFGDFGTTTVPENDVDEFGDFGSAGEDAFGATTTANGGNEDDDDDGFGDFGEVQAAGAGGDDDDFGDFNDFADGDGFQESGDFGDFEDTTTATGDDPFAASDPVPAEPSPVIEEVSVETAPDFTAVNSRQVENYVLEKLEALFPIDSDMDSPEMLNEDIEDLDISTELSKQALWTALSEQSFQGRNSNKMDMSSAPQFQWKNSELRRQYYASLGLAIVKEHITSTSSSIPNSSMSPNSKVSSPMIVGSEAVKERKPLNLEATLAFCQFTPENLGGYSGDEMKDIIAQLSELTRQASEELTYWLDQREQMLMDSERYNEMIASLVGRAAKLKDAESKQATKTKRLTRTSFNLK